MLQYLVTNLSSKLLGKLRGAGISYTPGIQIGGDTGVLIAASDMTRALIVLERGLEITRSEYDGVTTVRCVQRRATDSETCETIDYWEGFNEELFHDLVETKLAKKVHRPVVMRVPHKRYVKPIADGKIHIFFWATPNEDQDDDEMVKPPATAWGIALRCRDKSFVASSFGVSIIDPETGWEAAEVVGENVYFHHDIVHNGHEDELSVCGIILDEVAKILLWKPEKYQRHLQAQMRKQRAKSVQNYVDVCKKRRDSAQAQLQEEMDDLSQQLGKAQSTVISLSRRVDFVRAALAASDQVTADDELFRQEFLQLRKLDHVQSVEIHTNGTVEVVTDVLFCEHPTTHLLHEIGAFKIRISWGHYDSCVRMQNVTRRVDGFETNMHAPHVTSDGTPCWGNMAEVVSELIPRYEVIALINVCISYLQTANMDDVAGVYLSKWPIAAEKSTAKRKRRSVA